MDFSKDYTLDNLRIYLRYFAVFFQVAKSSTLTTEKMRLVVFRQGR